VGEFCKPVNVDGRLVCQAKKCPHRLEGGGCKLGKVSLTCDNMDCKWNIEIAFGRYGCKSMDLHLDANGRCLGIVNSSSGKEITAKTSGALIKPQRAGSIRNS